MGHPSCPVRVWFNGRIRPSQGWDEGSIPFTRSIFRLVGAARSAAQGSRASPRAILWDSVKEPKNTNANTFLNAKTPRANKKDRMPRKSGVAQTR